MASNPKPELTVGRLISEAIETAKGSSEVVLPTIGGLTVLAVIAQYLALNGSIGLAGLMQIVLLIAAVGASYIVLETMLKKAGLQSYSGPRRFLPYLGLTILVILGVIAGMILLIVPGVYLAVRWSLAQARLVARGDGVMDSLKASWDLTKGYSLRIFLAILAFGLIGIVIGFIAGLLGPTNIVGLVISQLASYTLSMIMLGLAVVLFSHIDPHGKNLSQVFE